MNSSIKKPIEKQKTVRISKKDKEKLKGATNWASLVAEEKRKAFESNYANRVAKEGL